MTKLMKVCIGNNQRIDSWNVQALKLWTRIRKHWYLCLDVGITKTILWKSFEVMNEIFIFNSFCIKIKCLCCCLRFSPVAPYHSDHWRSFENFNRQQNAKVWKRNTMFYVCLLVKKKLNDSTRINLFYIFVSTTTDGLNFGCPRNFFLQLFPNWTASSPITYTNT